MVGSRPVAVHPQNLVFNGGRRQPEVQKTRVGLLALQGDFEEHANMLRRLGVQAVETRRPAQLKTLDALIVPGGESTTIGKLAQQFGLMAPLKDFIRRGRPVWGTCAGLIFLSRHIHAAGSGADVVPPRLAVMDISVNRNAFGRQVDSFEADLVVPSLEQGVRRPFRAVFIRAPRIEKVGPAVDVLARLSDGRTIVAARQDNLLATSFHPELTADTRFHAYFLGMLRKARL